MTENRAIELLEYIRRTGNGEAPYVGCAQEIAIDMAIKALEEIKQYRAMEEKLNGISVKEVVNGFISAVEKETCEGYERGRILTNEDAEKWNAYRAIGTVEEIKEKLSLLEKYEELGTVEELNEVLNMIC